MCKRGLQTPMKNFDSNILCGSILLIRVILNLALAFYQLDSKSIEIKKPENKILVKEEVAPKKQIRTLPRVKTNFINTLDSTQFDKLINT